MILQWNYALCIMSHFSDRAVTDRQTWYPNNVQLTTACVTNFDTVLKKITWKAAVKIIVTKLWAQKVQVDKLNWINKHVRLSKDMVWLPMGLEVKRRERKVFMWTVGNIVNKQLTNMNDIHVHWHLLQTQTYTLITTYIAVSQVQVPKSAFSVVHKSKFLEQ